MAFHLPRISLAKKFLRRTLTTTLATDVPKGFFAVYVGEMQKRYVVPVSYLGQSSFQNLLTQAEEEFGYDHPLGGLTIPCNEARFIQLTSRLNSP